MFVGFCRRDSAVGASQPRRGWTKGLPACLIVAHLCAAAQAAVPSIEDLRRFTIEELANVEVTSVFKRAEPLSSTPASVWVITREEIHRSGAQTLPEALRLAPNLQVARHTSNAYAISARGFNHFNLSNKLLVLIDGRSIYTPLHAGVLWDEHQMMVEDVERIEVISGPAGTTWGANAMNGTINIITRNAAETQGGLAVAGGGTLDKRAAFRYGGKIGDMGAWRAYGQILDRGTTLASDGSERNDDWLSHQGGFRTDWQSGNDRNTVQGDIFENTFTPGSSNIGGNVLGRWNRRLAGGSDLTIQTYYTHVTAGRRGWMKNWISSTSMLAITCSWARAMTLSGAAAIAT